MIPPRGFKADLYPLAHKFYYSAGLNAKTDTLNSVWCTLVKNYKGVADPKTIIVNRHDADVQRETGAICSPMSIIDKLTLQISFQRSSTDAGSQFKCMWTPFFCQFAEKYDAVDVNGTSVAAIMQLTKDATQEDITPISTNKLTVVGSSDKAHPLSTVHITEAYNTHLNMTTDATMEDTPFDMTAFQKVLQYGSNKGALKACLGRTRHVNLDANHLTKQFFIRKFVPRSIRRIMPYTFFGILIHVPITSEEDQFYHAIALNATLSHIGIKCRVRYDEWHPDFSQELTA